MAIENMYLKFNGKPPKIYDFSINEIVSLLDIFIKKTNEFAKKNDINRSEFSILKPFHVLTARTETCIYFGFSNQNATMFNTNLMSLNGVRNSEDVESDLYRAATNELGFVLSEIIHFEIKTLEENVPFLKEYFLNNKEQQFHVPNKLLSEMADMIVYSYEQIKKRSNIVEINPIFKARDISISKNLCFTLLPFTDELRAIFDINIAPIIKEKFKMQILRADDLSTINEIMEDVWIHINMARFLIADISGKNPNVFYELGICHTIGKEVITICEEGSYKKDYGEKFPFDISHRRIITYQNTGPGMKLFEDQLINTIEHILGDTSLDPV